MEILCVMAALAALFLGQRGAHAQSADPGRAGPAGNAVLHRGGAYAGRYGRGAVPRRLGCVRPVCGRRRVGAAAAERG